MDNPSVRVRFAPSPTGLLHIGSFHTALFNWLFARQTGGKFLLRIEDTDASRSRSEWVDAIFEVMQWMGMTWDEEVVFQSERVTRYQERARQLVSEGKAYYCYYLPEELEERKQAAMKEGRSWRNDRRYAYIGASEREELERQGRKPVIRLFIPEGKTVFEDRILGKIEVDNNTLDDFVIARSDGSPLYHLAVVVDDIDTKISHVIRGMDHVSNTPKHVQLFQALGYALPEFAHLPNILGEDKKKLSKRHGAVSVVEYRDAGYLPDAILNYLCLLGWQSGDDQEFFSREELIRRFSLDQVHKRDTVFDIQKFEWLNGQHLLTLSPEELVPLVVPFFIRDGIFTLADAGHFKPYLIRVIDLLRERCRTLADFAGQGKFFFVEPDAYNSEAVAKHWIKEPQNIVERLEWLYRAFPGLPFFDAAHVEQVIRDLAEEHQLKAAQFIHPCRVALTGEMAGPSLFHLIEILGRERCLVRFSRAISWIRKELYGSEKTA